VVLAGSIDRLAARFRLSEGLAGLLTALGANSPEISTAVVAIISRKNELGFGVILGSNIFNLAALLGLSAVVSGSVTVATTVAAVNGFVALAITTVALMLLLGWMNVWIAAAVVALVFVPYLTILALKPSHLSRLRSRGRMFRILTVLAGKIDEEARKDQQPRQGEESDALTLVPALAATVLGSVGMLNAAEGLGGLWGISTAVIGTVLLAALSGLPNVLAAIRLSRHGRGAAVVSEALNSNSLNIVAGILVPTLLLGGGKGSAHTQVVGWFLLGMTSLTAVLLMTGTGLKRTEGLFLIAVYVGFVVMICRW
jgi:cation:H+ antiporter